MTSNSGIYTISHRELEGHDNLGHSISEVTIADTKSKTSEDQSHNSMSLKPQLRFNRTVGLSLDFVIAVLAIIWIAMAEFGFVPNHKQGFYCGTDSKISYKYTGDTISTVIVMCSLVLPIILMFIVEVLRSDREVTKKSRKALHQTLIWSREYVIAFAIKLFIVESLKVLIGELRPHFLDTCRPDAAMNCTRGEFITKYTCTNKRVGFYLLGDSSRSFPSAHAAIGLYEAVFASWYIHRRFPPSRSFLLVPLMHCLILTWGLACGATRVTDNRHFWWDVVVGDLIGVLFAIIACALLCKNFREKTIPEHINQNGHTSVRRLLSDTSCKEESNIAMAQA